MAINTEMQRRGTHCHLYCAGLAGVLLRYFERACIDVDGRALIPMSSVASEKFKNWRDDTNLDSPQTREALDIIRKLTLRTMTSNLQERNEHTSCILTNFREKDLKYR